MMRPLGAAERMMWMAGHHRTTQFAIGVELSGELDLRALQLAFDKVCTDTLFHSKFVIDDAEKPWLVPSRRPGIRVVLKDGDPSEWSNLLSEEVSTPMADDASLIRVSVLKAPGRASMVFCAHHSLLDALSVIEILNAVMRRLAGEASSVFVPGLSLEEMVALHHPEADGKSLPPPKLPNDDVHIRSPDARPTLSTRVLGEAATSSLRRKAHDMGVTVYSVVCAAFSAAMLLVNPERTSSRFICPVDLRKRLFGGGRCAIGLYAISVSIEDDAGGTDIWTVARSFSQKLEEFTRPGNLAEGIRARGNVIDGIRTPKEATRLVSRSRADFLVSNLGEMDMAERAGSLRVDAVWGPSVDLGEESLQTIGMGTHAGRLHFLHSSYRPVIGLLDAAVWMLESAI